MTTQPPPAAVTIFAAEAATVTDTRQALIDRPKRAFTPVAKTFIQNPDHDAADRRSSLSTFVNNGDQRSCPRRGAMSYPPSQR